MKRSAAATTAAVAERAKNGDSLQRHKRSRGSRMQELVEAEMSDDADSASASASASAAALPSNWPLDSHQTSLMMDCLRPLTDKEKAQYKAKHGKDKTHLCLFCDSCIKFVHTTNLKTHIEGQHPLLFMSVLEAASAGGYNRAKSKLEEEYAKLNKQKKASSLMRYTMLNNSSVDHVIMQMAYVLHLIVRGIPFNVLEDMFLLAATTLAKTSVSPNRMFVDRKALPLLTKLAHERNVELFGNMPFVSGVTDTWSRKGRVSVVNLRGLDDEWRVVTRAVGMFVLAGQHSSESEAALVKGTIDEVTSDSTVLVCMASDTENKAKKTCRLLVGEDNRIGCAGHILHLTVHDFVDEYKLQDGMTASTVIEKVRDLARSFRTSPTWNLQLAWAQQQLASASGRGSSKPLAYIMDGETRWNSMYDMCERALHLHEATKLAFSKISNANPSEFVLSDHEHDMLGRVCRVLLPVKIISKELQATKTATLSRMPFKLHTLYEALGAMPAPADVLLGKIRVRFKDVFDVSQVDGVHIALRAAAVDPSFADMHFLDDAQRDAVWAHVDKEALLLLVKPNLSDDELQKGFGDDPYTPVANSIAALRFMSVKASLALMRQKFEVLAPERRSAGLFDPYEYWRTVADADLTRLKPLARALLTAPASSADSERSFSSAGYIDDPLRGAMADQGISDLVLIRDWALSEGVEEVLRVLRRCLEELAAQ